MSVERLLRLPKVRRYSQGWPLGDNHSGAMTNVSIRTWLSAKESNG